MSWNNKVIWSEGLFLRPQHFQQNDRYFETYIQGRCSGIRNYSWGIKEIVIDDGALALGKVAISRLRGILPDGTPFNIPHDDEPPISLDITEDVRNKVVYLTLPLKRRDATEVEALDNEESLARFYPKVDKCRDNNAGMTEQMEIEVGTMRLNLMLEGEGLGQYATLGIARIVECRSDKKVVMDLDYIPPVLDCRAAPKLYDFLSELEGLFHQRGDVLAGRVSSSGRGGSAEIADFMLLQCVNRYEPLMNHLATSEGLHPETFYQYAVQMAGELATFSSTNRRTLKFPTYNHENLADTFAPVMNELRRSLSMVMEQTAVPLNLQAHKYGIHVATIADRNLLKNSYFVLAAHANIPTEELSSRFPAQVKAGPAEMISELVNLQLPGIALHQMAVAPRQIPYHSGFSYFELNRSSDLWKKMSNTGGFAFHIGGEFPGLELEFWAIKE
ncbi:MAG: type VI secretion system baseplate subunit TssK [Gammaproteobacteria bacterium]|nr:type VI secretion system baseplate subunit TssK [Gammaproteobacteria bacterium]MDH5802702.1 type VI secretion system baseplate subunit TssK [Gammaproteobacteria bacterium]